MVEKLTELSRGFMAVKMDGEQWAAENNVVTQAQEDSNANLREQIERREKLEELKRIAERNRSSNDGTARIGGGGGINLANRRK